MQLTLEQEKALKVILQKYKNHEKYVTICGYAGVGKSTLVKFAIDALQVNPERIAYACFTGKAAEVLRKKGNKNAVTLHKLLYDSHPKKDGGFIRIPKASLNYDIVVVDEISLAPRSMLEMLLKHNVFCIFIGDNFQLPQISKDESHDFLDHPDIFLSKIMRQAEESEIIRLTMKIRAGEAIPYTKGNEVLVAPRKDLVTGHLTWADQILCATNATRIAINNQMREILGFHSDTPESGEKLICLRNYWDDLSEDGEASLVNGMTGVIENPFETFVQAPGWIKMKNHRLPIICGNFIADDGSVFSSVDMDKKMIQTGEKCIDWREAYALNRVKMKIGDIVPREFAYGYAITTHKSQGSEWDRVLVLEEQFPFDKKEHSRWLYTAATRAAEKLVLVRD